MVGGIIVVLVFRRVENKVFSNGACLRPYLYCDRNCLSFWTLLFGPLGTPRPAMTRRKDERDTRGKKPEIFTVVRFRPDETRLTRAKISCTPIDRQRCIAVTVYTQSELTRVVFEIVDKMRRNTRAHLKSLITSVV